MKKTYIQPQAETIKVMVRRDLMGLSDTSTSNATSTDKVNMNGSGTWASGGAQFGKQDDGGTFGPQWGGAGDGSNIGARDNDVWGEW